MLEFQEILKQPCPRFVCTFGKVRTTKQTQNRKGQLGRQIGSFQFSANFDKSVAWLVPRRRILPRAADEFQACRLSAPCNSIRGLDYVFQIIPCRYFFYFYKPSDQYHVFPRLRFSPRVEVQVLRAFVFTRFSSLFTCLIKIGLCCHHLFEGKQCFLSIVRLSFY